MSLLWSPCASSVRSLPRRFGNLDTQVAPLGLSKRERRLSHFDGGVEINLLEAVPACDRTNAQKNILATADKEEWLVTFEEAWDKVTEKIMPGFISSQAKTWAGYTKEPSSLPPLRARPRVAMTGRKSGSS